MIVSPLYLSSASSPFLMWNNSPSALNHLLGEQREGRQHQTVPSTPNLSIFARKPNSESGNALPAVVGSSRASNRYSPAPALVPDGENSTTSCSPLHRQAFASVERTGQEHCIYTQHNLCYSLYIHPRV